MFFNLNFTCDNNENFLYILFLFPWFPRFLISYFNNRFPSNFFPIESNHNSLFFILLPWCVVLTEFCEWTSTKHHVNYHHTNHHMKYQMNYLIQCQSNNKFFPKQWIFVHFFWSLNSIEWINEWKNESSNLL